MRLIPAPLDPRFLGWFLLSKEGLYQGIPLESRRSQWKSNFGIMEGANPHSQVDQVHFGMNMGLFLNGAEAPPPRKKALTPRSLPVEAGSFPTSMGELCFGIMTSFGFLQHPTAPF